MSILCREGRGGSCSAGEKSFWERWTSPSGTWSSWRSLWAAGQPALPRHKLRLLQLQVLLQTTHHAMSTQSLHHKSYRKKRGLEAGHRRSETRGLFIEESRPVELSNLSSLSRLMTLLLWVAEAAGGHVPARLGHFLQLRGHWLSISGEHATSLARVGQAVLHLELSRCAKLPCDHALVLLSLHCRSIKVPLQNCALCLLSAPKGSSIKGSR